MILGEFFPRFRGSAYSGLSINKVTFLNGGDFFQIVKLSDSRFIGLSNTVSFFILLDSIGESKKTFFEYPYADRREKSIKNNYRSMAYQGLLRINNNKMKFVYASNNGEILHFYNFHNDSISLIKKIEKKYPKYKPQELNDGYGSIIALDNIVGYISIEVTDEFVYALYCGKKIEELLNNNVVTKTSNEIRKFDWDGNIINKYILDVYCQNISVSNDNSIIWAIAFCPEITPVYFYLQ